MAAALPLNAAQLEYYHFVFPLISYYASDLKCQSSSSQAKHIRTIKGATLKFSHLLRSSEHQARLLRRVRRERL